MSEVLKACGIAIITITLSAVLKSQGSALSQYLPQISAIVIFAGAISAIIPIIRFVRELAGEQGHDTTGSVSVLFLAASISIISKIITDICKENGAEMLKNAVEFSANTEIMLLCVPVIKELLLLITEVVSL